LRNDEKFAFVAAWKYKGSELKATLHREELQFNEIKLSQRSYK